MFYEKRPISVKLGKISVKTKIKVEKNTCKRVQKSAENCRNLTKVFKSFHFIVRNVQKITRFYFNILLDWGVWGNFRAVGVGWAFQDFS